MLRNELTFVLTVPIVIPIVPKTPENGSQGKAILSWLGLNQILKHNLHKRINFF